MTTIGALVGTHQQRIGKKATSISWLAPTTVQRGLVLFTDLCLLILAAAVALGGHHYLPFRNGELVTGEGLFTTLIILGWPLMLGAFGAYDLRHLRAGAVEYKRVLLASSSSAGVVGISCYLAGYEYSRGLFVLLFTVGVAFLLVGRFARRRFLYALFRRGQLLTSVIVAGDTKHVDAIARVLRRETWLGYQVAGALTNEGVDSTIGGLPVLGRIDDVELASGAGQVDAVIFAEGAFADPKEFRRMAWRLENQDLQMIVVPTLTDISSERLSVRPVAGLPLMDVDRPRALDAARWIKRSFDVVGSSLLLLLCAPVLALVALAIRIEDGGPVLFRQLRVGRKGEEFHCLKFRSMVPDAEARLAALQLTNEGAGPLFKMTHDPRVTKVGRFIRRFSLDELPQLWNVLIGDMSLVGPRPALPSEVAQYDTDTNRRLDVRPGMSGLWQVSGRSNLSWEDTVRLDLYYVDNWSMTQDLMILARTAKAVVSSAGAY